ncbi:WD40-repeat-containing domain protein [Mycotypha africana]|uniref:WD40-repeat-containing domain protein n=1 Tax=Mycotypha africana TaxID=64632 RepID=UPI0023012FBD|nr:WD40-repeat-containing domain protein [Mycotypha africana]KAI8984324.1 WD40-repeat-containing domain protein [Mycotypha africana]
MAIDPFFTSARKRKRSNNKKTPATAAQKQKKVNKKEDSDVEGDSGEEDQFNANLSQSDVDVSSEEEEIEETAAEKRVRLAKAYLGSIEKSLEDDGIGFDAADLDKDLIAERLKKDDDESEGRLHMRIADRVRRNIEKIKSNICRGHQLPVTAVALAENGTIFYSASKEGSIIKWDAKTFKKLHTFPGGRKGVKNFDGHTDHILCLAISNDGKYLASGGKDKCINIWSVTEDKHIAKFTQHRDAVSGLAFRKTSNQLYSASHDRTIKLWNIDEKAYIETLFGHQDQITGIDTLVRERCLSVGGRDKTARWWKIVEESQLVYRGGISSKNPETGAIQYVEGSLDCLAQIDESMFVTGGDSGLISLWDIQRKKPVFSLPTAHGLNTVASESEGDINTPYWITALASLKFSDLFVSGSWDGYIRLYKLAQDNRSFKEIGKLPVNGVVNDIQIKQLFPSKRTLIVVAVGQELKLGRWIRLKNGVKNCTKIFELEMTSTGAVSATVVDGNGDDKGESQFRII